MEHLPLDPMTGDFGFPHEDTGRIERGTVGWADGSWYDLGTSANDGHLVLHVTLYRGRDHSKPLKPGTAQGYEIICQVGLVPARIPPIGTPVIVAVPAELGTSPGASVVIAAVEKNPVPATEFGTGRAVMNLGDVTLVANALKLGDANATAVALANLVDARLSTIRSAFNGHTHGPGLMAAGGDPVIGVTDTPSPLGPLASVAATKCSAT